jgi:FtsH-binding integral membrane protein
MFTFTDISEKTQKHLTKVYSTLLVLSALCALGMYVNHSFIVSGFFLNLISICLSVYLIFQVANRHNQEDWRMGCLAGLAFQMGFLVGPAMHLLVAVHPQLVLQALMYTATAFTSFTLISLYSKRRSYLFVGGIILALVQGMMMYRLTGWLLGWRTYNL